MEMEGKKPDMLSFRVFLMEYYREKNRKSCYVSECMKFVIKE